MKTKSSKRNWLWLSDKELDLFCDFYNYISYNFIKDSLRPIKGLWVLNLIELIGYLKSEDFILFIIQC